MTDSSPDYYADLGISAGATTAAIKAAFHALARQHHPDKTGGGDSTAFRTAREAFEKLSDPDFRAQYDHARRSTARPGNANVLVEEEDVFGPFGPFGHTRTEQFAAADEARRRSPPPTKPKRGSQEPSWAYYNGRAFTAWVKRDREWRERHPEPAMFEADEQEPLDPSSTACVAHGLRVKMSDHPASREFCSSPASGWQVQAAGQDICIFCLTMHNGGSRCPRCQALACPACLREIIGRERDARSSWTSGFAYRPGGG